MAHRASAHTIALTPVTFEARDLTLDAARDASAVKRPTREAMSTANLKKLLDSRNEREVLEGLRRVIAVLSLLLLDHTICATTADCNMIALPPPSTLRLVSAPPLLLRPEEHRLSIRTSQEARLHLPPRTRRV